VRIRYDAASAGSSGGGPRIEIRTQPGGDRWRTNASFRVRDEGLNARNAFAPERPQGALHQFSWSFNGPIVKNKTGLSFCIDRTDSVERQAIRAATPDGVFGALIHQPTDRCRFPGRLEHALTRQTSGCASSSGGRRHGDQPARRTRSSGTRVHPPEFSGECAPHFNATPCSDGARHALSVRGGGRSTPANRATATKVAGAFSGGGARIQGGRDTLEFEFEDELMFPVRNESGDNRGPRHRLALSGGEWRNAGGTFSFADLDDFNAVLPTTYAQSRRSRFAYSLYRFGAFVPESSASART
jgi:hypothetical protein